MHLRDGTGFPGGLGEEFQASTPCQSWDQTAEASQTQGQELRLTGPV